MALQDELVNINNILDSVLIYEDKNTFLNIVKDAKDVNINPIINYHNSIVGSDNIDLLTSLYIKLKYYLEEKNDYPEPLQEGLALLASKVAILKAFMPNKLRDYFDIGDYSRYLQFTNPFEEIVRLLLCSVKQDPNFYNDRTNRNSKDSLMEIDACTDIVSKAINGMKLYQDTELLYNWSLITDIGRHLVCSNVSSDEPMSARDKNNKSVIIEQFDKIRYIYSTRITTQILLGNLPTEEIVEKLYTRFDNKILYAIKNIGVYEKTKRK